MAAHGTEQKVLRQMVRAADLIAADKIGVVRFEIIRGNNAAGKDFRTRAGGIAFKDLQRALGKGGGRRGPVGRRNLALGIAQSSGQPALDAAALKAVKSAAPFARAPKGLTAASYSFSLPITFKN